MTWMESLQKQNLSYLKLFWPTGYVPKKGITHVIKNF